MKFNLIPKTATFIVIVASALVLQTPAFALDFKGKLEGSNVNLDSVSDNPASKLIISQSLTSPSPLDGTWRLTFVGNNTVHSALLTMQGSYGVATVTYFDRNLKKIQKVDQIMKLKYSSEATFLFGYEPVYSGTSIPAIYIPDNFIFRVEGDSLQVANYDDQKVFSWVNLVRVR